MAEKTEKATPKKLRDARKKGQVAKSQDFPSAFTFIVSISATLYFADTLYRELAGYLRTILRMAANPPSIANEAGGLFFGAIQIIMRTSLPLMVIVSCIGVLVSFLIIGPVFSIQAMKPDLKKLNPVTNLKNMFKVKTFIELLKSILKITGAVILIYTAINDSLVEIISTSGRPLIFSAIVFATFLKKVILRVGIFFILVGIFDLVFQRKNFAKEMKMEKFEVKQEYKDTEGHPEIKQKRRQTAQEIAYQEGPASVKRAKAVITNPTHIAVALEYDMEEEPAPKILTMGQDLVAEQIISVAQDNNIPIMRNVELAHTLYYKAEIGGFVPEETYAAIAEILKWVAKLEAKQEQETDIFKDL